MKFEYHKLMSTFLGHLSHSGDLLLWVGVRRRPSCVVRRALTFSSQELLGQSELILVCSICRVRRQEIVNFMTPHRQGEVHCNSGVKSVKYINYFTF